MTTTEPGLRPPRYLGARVLRVEDARFLMGRATYVDDVQLPGMLHAAFLRSPYGHARIASIDADRARAHPGVVAVLTGADFEPIPPFVTSVPRPDVKTSRRHVLPLDKVRHVGEAVAVAVATSRDLAEDACELIELDLEPLPAVVDAEAALEPDAPVVDESLGDNRYAHIEYERGDVEQAFARADRVFSKRFHVGRVAAAPLEGRAIVADFDPSSSSLTIWASTQFPHYLRTLLAGPLGVPENNLRVVAPAVGGGFGLKCSLFVEDVIIPHLARTLARPVKWIEDRYENLAASGHAKELVCYLEAAVNDDGRLLAFRGRYVGDGGAYQCHPWTCLIDTLCAATILPGTYAIDAVRYEVDQAITNKCPGSAYRGVGWTSGNTARESLIDDIARGLGMDPVELRIRNTIPEAPYVTLTGFEYDGGSYIQSQRKAMELVEYDAFRERQRRAREEGRYLGIGFSVFVEQGAWTAAMAKVNGFGEYGFLDSVDVTMEPDGSVTVTTGLHSHGQSHETTFAQLAADVLGVRLESVRVVQGDTAGVAYSHGTYGSRSAVIGGGAILRAAGEVRDKLLKVAAHALEVSEEDIDLYDGRATVRGAPARSLSVAELTAKAYFGVDRPPDLEPALTSTRSYDPPQTFSNACIVAVVEVDVGTGLVDVQRMAIVEDCGTIMNPMVVEGQIAGAIAQAIGAALYEELPYDEDGQLLAASLMDYLYPSTMEVPPMAMAHIETPSPVTEGGFKGMGEGGLVGGPAAVVNAVADALSPLGVTIEETPLTPSRVLGLIEAARSRASSGV